MLTCTGSVGHSSIGHHIEYLDKGGGMVEVAVARFRPYISNTGFCISAPDVPTELQCGYDAQMWLHNVPYQEW